MMIIFDMTEQENLDKLKMILFSYRGMCPLCDKGHIVYRTKKTDKPTLTFLGCDRFPKCLWTSYKHKVE